MRFRARNSLKPPHPPRHRASALPVASAASAPQSRRSRNASPARRRPSSSGASPTERRREQPQAPPTMVMMASASPDSYGGPGHDEAHPGMRRLAAAAAE